MNNILLFILLFSLNTDFLSKQDIEISRDQYSETIAIPLGGNAYQTAGSVKEKIGNSGIESWSDHQSEFSIYIKSAEEKQVLLSLELLEQEGNAEILIDFDGASTINLEKGQSGNVPVKEIKLLAGYNQITLKAVSKEAADYAKIKNLIFSYEGEISLNYVKDNIDNRFYWGRRGPSVHLTYTLPENQNFKWFYNEVSVPVGQDPIGSYFMANGFGEGYFGIQVNSETERRILFSVWSPFKTDNPNEIPEEEKIKLLKKGEDVYTGEFGNEGSGGQSFLKYPWKAGQTYRFLNSVEPDGNGNTIYTAYFYDPEVGNWILIASFLRPKTDTWYKSPHSFLENFVPQSGNIQRMGEYQNQWATDKFGNWVELTEAKFTGDDIARRGYRMDYAGGSGLGKFYLKNGGFFNENTQINSMHIRPSQGTAPSIDWDKLP